MTKANQHAAKTHCPKGHPYEGLNLIWHKSRGRKSRMCRICQNEHNRLYRQRLRDRLNPDRERRNRR